MDEILRNDEPKYRKFLTKLILVWIVTVGWWGPRSVAQTLDKVRSDARAVSSPSTQQSPPDHDHDHDHCHDDDDDNNFVGELIGAVFFGNSNRSSTNRSSSISSRETGSAGSSSVQSNDIDYELFASQSPSVSFLGYPYANDQLGIAHFGGETGQPLQLQTAFWYGTDFDNLDSWNGQFQVDHQGVLGFEFQWAHLTEKLTGLPRDSLNLADFNLTWRLIEHEALILRCGGGLNLLADRFGTTADYNLTLSADFFPVRPVVTRFEFDYGELGAIHQTHLLTTVGLNLRHVEVLTGYEYRNLGGTEIDGPLLGMRLWW